MIVQVQMSNEAAKKIVNKAYEDVTTAVYYDDATEVELSRNYWKWDDAMRTSIEDKVHYYHPIIDEVPDKDGSVPENPWVSWAIWRDGRTNEKVAVITNRRIYLLNDQGKTIASA